MRRTLTIAALAVALLLGGSALAAPPAKTYPTGRLAVAGVAIAPSQVLDARALPDAGGRPSLMVTLTPDAARAVTTAAKGARALPVTLDGMALGTSATDALASGNVLQLSGDYGDYDAAGAIARRISGKDPVPETESDE